ncbi:uncharacterized protein LOC144146545 [Haemaphysalis longicornis]
MIRACVVLALAASALAGYTGFGGYSPGYNLACCPYGYARFGLSHYVLPHGVDYPGLGLGYGYAPGVANTVSTYHAAPAVTTVAHAAPVTSYAAVHPTPAVAATTIAHTPAVATVAHAAPDYGYGYGVGHYGFGHGLGAYGLNYAYGLGSPFDYSNLLRKKCKYFPYFQLSQKVETVMYKAYDIK